MTGNAILAEYHVRAGPAEIGAVARFIAWEQTVEVPEAMVPDPAERDRWVGRVEHIEPLVDQPGRWRVRIAYPAHLACGQLPQLLNLLYGNISLRRGIRLADVALAPEVAAALRGPRWGVDGLRALTGVYGRPLLATALKPRGRPTEQFAAMAGAFARGGGDLVKDDHNIVDADFEAFRERMLRVHEAVERANESAGRRTIYAPNLSASGSDLWRRLDAVAAAGIHAVLVCPSVLGLAIVEKIAADYPLVVLAHPSLAGMAFDSPDHGVEAGLMLGTMYRLAGADLVIFPNPGGRFDLPREACRSIARRLREPLASVRPALPAPAGGMTLERIGDMAAEYGPDSVFLIGGALLSHSDDLESSTARFREEIVRCCGETLVAPADAVSGPKGACEWPPSKPSAGPALVLRHVGSCGWEGRSPSDYKPDECLPFRGVSRVELIGRTGEATAFDLRYFEIEPGGFTSLEKHRHTHTVIGVRGQGVLVADGHRTPLGPHDIAYVDSLQVHQLRNEGEEPFGFYCIVDHFRDQPMEP
jgi:ribulose-bisphosphate carboxylase large chain